MRLVHSEIHKSQISNADSSNCKLCLLVSWEVSHRYSKALRTYLQKLLGTQSEIWAKGHVCAHVCVCMVARSIITVQDSHASEENITFSLCNSRVCIRLMWRLQGTRDPESFLGAPLSAQHLHRAEMACYSL